jgi:hypothetical protein
LWADEVKLVRLEDAETDGLVIGERGLVLSGVEMAFALSTAPSWVVWNFCDADSGGDTTRAGETVLERALLPGLKASFTSANQEEIIYQSGEHKY